MCIRYRTSWFVIIFYHKQVSLCPFTYQALLFLAFGTCPAALGILLAGSGHHTGCHELNLGSSLSATCKADARQLCYHSSPLINCVEEYLSSILQVNFIIQHGINLYHYYILNSIGRTFLITHNLNLKISFSSPSFSQSL